ncbi:patatin-like phospholipase family protein [Dyadobacter chenhuakuii]|uniref:Patatin-like phospholipase family protein n=1 Tax=Dyadobacter chenhuakuii TaxID=2909339 RepID=A0ABY4XSL7_9BACT|nr:patatin-like phospholipase family protein [Dyadobacter chenhuakuii]MCF2492265.1 patatin-like phospholipase family protein [Dyadobacter chenhuakuii]USJ33428.1 patatin-like phospholipase family protein [Dyadobacter chenhuakuii]
MKALVLGGGSMKGAFQVGVIQAVLENGFEPEMVYGISVGALNATFLANEAGKQMHEKNAVQWPVVSRKLLEFWIKNITQPQDISMLRSRVMLGMATLMSRFDGIVDPMPLHSMIRKHVNDQYLHNSPVKLKVGAVNIGSGEIKYASPDNPQFMSYVYASSSIPMLMPAVEIEQQLYLDGGLREVAPIRQAIEDGATEIVLIACHSPLLYQPEDMNSRNLITLIERVRDITVNQIVNSNIVWAESFVDRSNLRGKPMKLTVIRPAAPLFLDLQHFTSEDISRLIVEGYRAGIEAVIAATEKVQK